MRGGGSMLLINPRLLPRKTIISRRISNSDAYNISAACVSLGDQKTFVIAAYRPPWASREDLKALIQDLSLLVRRSVPIILMGDFNLPRINWVDRSFTPEDGFHNVFQNFVEQSGLSQLSFNTRGSATLDLVLVSDNVCAESCLQLPPIAGSDHLTQNFHIKVHQDIRLSSVGLPCNESSVSYNQLDLSCIDVDRTNQLLFSVDWNTIFSGSTEIDTMVSVFMKILWDIFNITAPFKRPFKRHPQRLPKAILRLIWRKRKAWKSFTKTGNRAPYAESCRMVKLSINKFHADQEKKLLNCNDKKVFFQYVNKRLGRHEFLPTTFKDSTGLTLDSDLEIANAFNSEFSHNFGVTISSCCPKGDADGLRFNCTIEDVRKYLLTTSNSAAGPDGISGRLLKNIALAVAYPLWRIFQQSFAQAKFPSAWKEALIQPIYKGKGDRDALDSYRPVSMCSVIGKALERLAKDQLIEHVKKECPLNRKQHGFCAQRSTITNLLEFDNAVSHLENNNLPYDIFTIDFCRAFDKVPHAKIMDVLSNKKLHQTAIIWLGCFLSNRKQRVRINAELSTPIDVTSGVVQGSSLGPAIFTLYADSLLEKIKSPCVAFADDLKFVNSPDTISNPVLQEDLSTIAEWSLEFFMPLSIEKCLMLHCGRKNPNVGYTCNGCPVPVSDKIKDLGVMRAAVNGYDCHPGYIITKANRLSGLILRAFRSRDRAVLWQAFRSYVTPVINYASSCWNPRFRKDINAIERVQRGFTKRLAGMRNLSYQERLNSLSVPSLSSQRTITDLVFTYRCMHGGVDINPATIGLQFEEGNTRGAGLHLKHLFGHNCRATSYYLFRIPPVWNSIPADILQTKSLANFKKRITDYIVKRGADGVAKL